MKLTEQILQEKPYARIISLCGAGGKTSCMFTLAREWKEAGCSVLVTSTTMMFHPACDKYPYDNVYVGDLPRHFTPQKGSITVLAAGVKNPGQKLRGFTVNALEKICKTYPFDYILIEADGARRKPLKAPRSHEPVVPEFSDIVLALIGLDAYGQILSDEWVFAVDEYCSVTNAKLGERITEQHLAQLIVSREGSFKGAPASAVCYLVLNKADSSERQDTARKIVQALQAEQNKRVLSEREIVYIIPRGVFVVALQSPQKEPYYFPL